MPQSDKRSVLEMIGEFLREAAVLVLVFVPLELYRPAHAISVGWFLRILGFSVSILAAGVILERIRPS